MVLKKRLFDFCGALPVVHVIFFFLATSKRVRQTRREFVPTYSIEGRGYSCGNGCLIFCGALPVVLVVFFFSCNMEEGALGKQEIICPHVQWPSQSSFFYLLPFFRGIFFPFFPPCMSILAHARGMFLSPELWLPFLFIYLFIYLFCLGFFRCFSLLQGILV